MSARLSEITGRGVDIAFLGQVEESAPLLVDAEEVLVAIERFREALPGLVEATVSWLRNSGIELG